MISCLLANCPTARVSATVPCSAKARKTSRSVTIAVSFARNFVLEPGGTTSNEDIFSRAICCNASASVILAATDFGGALMTSAMR